MSGYSESRLVAAPPTPPAAAPPPDTEGTGIDVERERVRAAAAASAPIDTHDAVGILVELHTAIAENTRRLDQITEELRPASSRIEDIDLVAGPNPGRPVAQYGPFRAVQVDNPYAVTLEVRGSRDGGGPIIMRVPPHTSRVVTARGREVSLRALAAAAGVIPATLILFDRPQPAGLYAYAP